MMVTEPGRKPLLYSMAQLWIRYQSQNIECEKKASCKENLFSLRFYEYLEDHFLWNTGKEGDEPR